ncbi:MAG: lamin tail domain-containing protein [Gracilimonas sp.]|uniref:lamin tail domain-containing protein n=1 Tax=Gracilimonas TaxID=649462 RepID=UPI001B1F7B37|nr:lamin tail domain-containing protein [Gracilimonas sp.]MBO6586989.1 lamin tail domain-containing protein [Gracilimonas sp.]
MRNTILLIFTLSLISISEISQAQTTLLSDDFEAGNLNSWVDDSTNHWAASTSSPINGSYSMKHALSSEENESYIYSSISSGDLSTKVTTWQFNLNNGSWDPSGSNFFGVGIFGDEEYVMSSTYNGYVVGINFNGISDILTLYKVTNGSYSAIISTLFDWGSGDLIGIEVERSSSGIWSLSYDTDGDFDNLTLGGLATDTDHTTFSYVTVYFEYTSTRAGELWVDDFSVEQELENAKAEPSSHATSFTATGSIKRIDLSWTDALGTTLPDGYLVKASDMDNVSDPTDGTAESDDSDLSDGAGALNVLYAEGSTSFTGLDETTTYYFKIYPYTNSGSDIDYKTDGTVPEDDATTLETPDIIFNEVLADPDGTSGDANGDGIVDTDDDEFIELVNYGATDIDISNWVFSDNSTDRYTFPSSTTLKALQAAVIFGGGTPTGDFGNSIVDSTSSLGLNNTGETITLKNGSGIEIISLTYGSEANNDESITRSPDLTGSFAQHETADTDDASSFSPGTRIDGTYFQPSVEITGNAGWRLLSLPIEDGTVADISDNTAVQGISGGDNAGADPNLFINPAYDGSDQSDYITPTNTTTPWGDGLGFILYFFDNSTNGSSPLPITLDAFGNAPDADVNVTISDTWTLAGNPFNSNLSIDDISGNDSGNGVNDGLTSPIYLYGASGWETVNLGSSNVIGDWSGFFVQRFSSSTTELTIPTAAATTDAVKLSKSGSEDNFRQINLLLEAPGNYSDRTTKLYFSDHSSANKDGFDGGKLSPLDGAPFLAFENDFGNGKELLVQDARLLDPTEEQRYELVIADAGISGSYTLSWPEMKNIPEDWEFTLNDYETGESVTMAPETLYEFEVEATQKRKETSASHFSAAQAETEEVNSRFSITLKTSTTTSTEQEDEPQTFALKQNYPNPFNPITTIEYSVSKSVPVTLTVYNVMGQQVAILVNETKPEGTYRVSWDAADMASGIYHYRLQAESQVMIRQMTLIK